MIALEKYKEDLANYLHYLCTQIAKSDVDVRLNVQATPENVRALAPDSIVIAVGARPIVLSMEKTVGAHVLSFAQALQDPASVGAKVTIIGGGTIGAELALELSEMGREVAIVEMGKELASNGNMLYRIALRHKYEALPQPIKIYYEHTCEKVEDTKVIIRDENGNTTDVAEEGEEIRIYPSANNGYRLGDLYVTYTDSDDEDQTIYPEAEYNSRDVLQYYWFEMPEYDVEIYADFGEGDYVAWIDRNNIEHGSIRVSPNVADEDDTVSVYVTPDSGYQLDELVVEDEDGRDVSTTALASGTRYTFRMPDSDVTISATFRSRNYTSNFTDVPRTEWYYEAVSYVATEGLMNGVSTTQFNPNGTASRAQIVTILWRLAGEPSALTGAFTDVPAGEYYSTAVAWASRQGIVTGVGNNRFEPNSNITREQLAVILYRYAQDAGYSTTASGSITGYYDYARVNGYARTALQWAVGTGLITGTSSTTLSPQDTATRAQVATILMRFCENIVR